MSHAIVGTTEKFWVVYLKFKFYWWLMSLFAKSGIVIEGKRAAQGLQVGLVMF